MFKLLGLNSLLVGAVAAAAIAAYFYYKNTQEELLTLRNNISTLELVNRTNEETIKQMTEQYERNQRLYEQLEVNLNQAEQDIDRLRGILSKHDLTNLADKKPGLIEKRINDATRKVWNDFGNVGSD